MKLNDESYGHLLPAKKDPWTDFYNFVLETGVTDNVAEWYVRWARQFFGYIKMPLRKCTSKDVKGFLDHLSIKMDTRQVEQAREALKLLYRDFLKVPWIKPPSSAGEEGMQAGAIYPEGHRHELPLQSEHKEDLSLEQIFKKLQTEIRYLHYSIRTEQTYLQWVRRFMHFHKLKPAESLSATDVKAYLEYLAVQRKVSASTQNQALLKAVSGQHSAIS